MGSHRDECLGWGLITDLMGSGLMAREDTGQTWYSEGVLGAPGRVQLCI